jgi:hypothetical protein
MAYKKMATAPIALVVLLSLVGVGYAHWSDYVQIEVTVYMGSLTLAFDPYEILDYVDNEGIIPIPKDVGWAEIYYDPTSYVEDVHTNKSGYKTLIFVVHNAYPNYTVAFTTVVLHNIGTIPIHITDLRIWDPTGELNWTWTTPPPRSPAMGFFWKDFNGNGTYEAGEEIMNVRIVNFVCHQLHPCESTKGEVDIHFKQPAEECHTYQFAIEIEGIQWNEYP